MTELKETVSSEARARRVVANLYTNGSDTRSEKNGSPGKLVTTLLAGKNIITCGLYAHLGREIRAYVNDKTKRREGDLKINKVICKFILEKEKEDGGKYFIHISSAGRSIIESILSTDEWTANLRKMFKVEVIFPFQERQKVTPKEAR